MSLKLPRNWDFNLKMDAAKIGTVSVPLCPSVPAWVPGLGQGLGVAVAKSGSDFGSGLSGGTWDLGPKCHFEREQMLCK